MSPPTDLSAKVPSDHHGKADPELTYSPSDSAGAGLGRNQFLSSFRVDSACVTPDGHFFSLSLETSGDGDP